MSTKHNRTELNWMQLWMNRKMEQKNKSNRCSSLFSSGIYITFCTSIYKNIGKFEIEFSFAVISSCLNKQMGFSLRWQSGHKFWLWFCNSTTTKINEAMHNKQQWHEKSRPTLYQNLLHFIWNFKLCSFFFQVMKKSLLFLTLSSSLSSPFAFLSFFFVCFNHSQTQ